MERDVPLADKTTFRIGGRADFLARARDLEELAEVIGWANENTGGYVLLGGGSNLLISDQGLAETVIILGDGFKNLELTETGGTSVGIRVGAAARLARLTGLAAREGLAELAFTAGIPGTVGGAAAMNAGTPEGDMSRVVGRLTVIGPDGRRRRFARKELTYGYRSLDLEPGAVIVEAELEADKSDPESVAARIRQTVRRRRVRQPRAAGSAGSFFRNPEGDFAGRLIEAAGLKGRRVGRAEVSAEHANFIVNLGGATAEEVLTLAGEVRDKVAERFGVELRPEVRFLGRGRERWPWIRS